jgi:hypothetical protein
MLAKLANGWSPLHHKNEEKKKKNQANKQTSINCTKTKDEFITFLKKIS